MSSDSPKREFDIDFFRGWVCLSLMFLHFYNALYAPYYNLFGETGKYLIWNWRLGIESFFVLAGFMMAHMLRPVPGENVAIAGYLKRRFFRLIIPYWTAVLIFACYRWAARLILKADSAPSLGDVIAQLFLAQEFFVAPSEMHKVVPEGYWSMVTLEQFYLLWLAAYGICLLGFGQNQGKGYGRAERVMSLLTFALCVGSLATWIWIDVKLPGSNYGWFVSDDGFRFQFGSEHLAVALPQFTVFLALGMLLYWAIRQKIHRAYFGIVMILLLAAAVWTNHSKFWKALVTVSIFIPLAHGYRVPDNLVLRFLAFCGKRSYSIYLIHAIAGIAFISLVARRLESKSDWLAIPVTLAAAVISILASMVFFRYVEQPCQEKSRTVAYRRKRAEPVPQAKTVPETTPAPVL